MSSLAVSGATVKIWTARSSLINGEFLGGVPLLTQIPYDRILAMEVEPGVVVESLDMADFDEPEVRLLNLPNQEMASRLARYFASVIVKNDIWLGDVRARPEADYNCHDFADALVYGMPARGATAAHDRVKANVSEYKLIQPSQWRAGQRGIVVLEPPEVAAKVVVRHSFVNLGELCINVLDVGGALGLTSLDDIATEFTYQGRPGILMAHVGPTA